MLALEEFFVNVNKTTTTLQLFFKKNKKYRLKLEFVNMYLMNFTNWYGCALFVMYIGIVFKLVKHLTPCIIGPHKFLGNILT